MQKEVPLGNPFRGEPRGAGQPRMVGGRPAYVAKAPPFYPKGVVIELRGR
jgi:hypothetical protein